MNKFLKTLSVVCILCFMAHAANILVWNFNPSNYDTITDPEVGQKVNAGYWLKTTLTNNSYTYTYHDNTKLPTDITEYDVIVGTLGFFVC